MAPGLPARWVIVCAVLATATTTRAQAPEAAERPNPAGSSAGTPPKQSTSPQPSGRRQVAVIDLSTDPAAEKLANELYNALVNHVDLRPLTNPNFVRSLKGPFADEEALHLLDASRAHQEAADLLVQLDYRSAEVAAERGMLALHNVQPSSDVLGLYAALAFDSGQAALRLRKPNDASLAFGLSYRLDPAKRPDPARYEPDIVEAYQLAVTKIPIPAKLEVKGAGTVWIDGIDRGSPGVFDVSHGRHLVQLSGFERETRGKQVNVPADSAIEIEAALASDERKVERLRVELARTRDAAARAGAVKRLAQLLGVGDAVLIEKSETGALKVQTWRDREPGFSKLVEHDSGSPGDLLVPLAPPRKVEPPKQELEPLPPVVQETPFYRRNWFYGGVAVTVLAAAVWIYIAATQDRMITVVGDVKQVDE